MAKHDDLEKLSSAVAEKYSPLILNSIIDDSNDLFAAIDQDFNFLAFNSVFESQFLQVYGIKIKLGDNLKELLVHLPEEQKKVTQAWGRALNGEEYEFIQEFGDQNFARKFFSIKFKVFKDEEGRALGVYQIVKDLSELKNTKEQLIDSEAIFHSFFNSSPMMMGVAEIEGNDIRHISDNSAASQFFGLPCEIMRGKLASELGVPRKEIDFWLVHYRRAQQTFVPQHFDYIHQTENGPRYLSVVVSLISNAPGSLPRFSYIVHDISERKQAEKDLIESKKMLEQRVQERTKTLQSSQQNFERMFNLAPFALAVVKKESGIIVHVNSAWTKLTGYSALEGIGKSTVAMGLFHDLNERENIYLEFMATGSVRNVNFTLKTKTQELRSILCNMDTIELEGFSEKDQNFVLVTMEDITERKMAEEAVKLEQHRLTAIIVNSPSCLSLKSSEGKYLIANPNFDKILGTSGESMIGKTDHDIFPEHFANAMRENDLVVLSGKKTSVEEQIPRADGVVLTFMSHKFPITDLDGKIESVCSISLDITARKKAEKDLRDSEERLRNYTSSLEEALRSRDDFLSIASHELKTPLTSLKLYAQLAKRNRDRGDDLVYGKENVNKLIDQIDKQSSRLARLIDDMLDISRIRTGKLNLQTENFDLCTLLSDTLDRLEPNFKEAGNTVSLKCNGPLPVDGDRYRIDQVITNILTNAMKYAAQKPIDIMAEKNPSAVRISISDKGIGMASDSLERIFNQFERAISANEVSGLGLGLFITKEIVEAHNGRIWAESEGPGHGSTFIVELPAKQ